MGEEKERLQTHLMGHANVLVSSLNPWNNHYNTRQMVIYTFYSTYFSTQAQTVLSLLSNMDHKTN
jgi:hypothetical protein